MSNANPEEINRNDEFADLDMPVDDANDQSQVTAEASASETTETPDDQASDELIKLRHERDEYYQKLLRATADFRNTQRRLEQDKELAVQYANSALIKQLLPVIDNFERALAVDPQTTDVPALLQGMQMVHDELLAVLKKHHVEPIAPKVGDPFNPEHHQAMMQQPDEKYSEPTVTMLLQKGYIHHDRVLRPAGVAVSKTE